MNAIKNIIARVTGTKQQTVRQPLFPEIAAAAVIAKTDRAAAAALVARVINNLN